MFKLVELTPLFHRILQNTMRDFYRRQKVRSTWTRLFSSFRPRDEADEREALREPWREYQNVSEDQRQELRERQQQGRQDKRSVDRAEPVDIDSHQIETSLPRSRNDIEGRSIAN